MDYQNTLTYLYNSVPMFQQVGGSAYKEGLENTRILDEHFGHPHRSFRTIHVAGTNGKGSCSHTLAAILQEAGYRVGLYTSPHLVDFRERIRINGQPIPEEYVVRFVEKERDFFEPLHPSFFELTTAMAFRYSSGFVPYHQHKFRPHPVFRRHVGKDSRRKGRHHQGRHPRRHRRNHSRNQTCVPAKSGRRKSSGHIRGRYDDTRLSRDENRIARALSDKEYAYHSHRLTAAARSRLPDRRTKHTQRFRPCLRTDGINGTLAKAAGRPHPDMRHRTQRRRHQLHCRTIEAADLPPATYCNRYGK